PTPTPTPTPTRTPRPTRTPTATPTPAGKISVPSSMNFPNTGIGSSSSKTLTIKNNGDGALSGNLAIGQPSNGFGVGSGTFSVPADSSTPVTITFAPGAAGSLTATLTINSNDPSNPTVNVTLTGSGEGGKLSAPNNLSITSPIGQTTTATLTLENKGKGVLTGTVSDESGDPEFSVGGAPVPLNIAAGESQAVSVSFTPAAKGKAVPATVAITVDAPSTGSTTVNLKGTGQE
ncbi:MAG: choice-of-anchor D domain-containing protein, partial [Candidatus Binataceae bacterium]